MMNCFGLYVGRYSEWCPRTIDVPADGTWIGDSRFAHGDLASVANYVGQLGGKLGIVLTVEQIGPTDLTPPSASTRPAITLEQLLLCEDVCQLIVLLTENRPPRPPAPPATEEKPEWQTAIARNGGDPLVDNGDGSFTCLVPLRQLGVTKR